MRQLLSVMAVVALLLSVAVAQDDEGDGGGKKKTRKAPRQKKPAAAMQEMTLTGTISKVEKKGKGDKVSVSYILTDAEGTKIRLPQPKKPKKKGAEAAAAISLADFVDQQVTVVGKGRETKRKDKKSIQLRSITSVEKLEAKEAGGDAKADDGKVEDAGDAKW